ncbi:MAG: isocitrate lyase/PEP mutase family protein [Rhodococcus sp. (in: high G+C Gram-positive bacteria)]
MIVAPGVYDGLSAALVESAGFSAGYMSGAAVSASAVGLPDIGLATMTEMVAQAVVIRRRFSGPLIADADTGFGDVTNVYRTVQEYVRAGVSAIQLEDQVFPKRCGHLEEKQVVDQVEFTEKIQAAVQARGDSEVLLVARTDARATHGFPNAIGRAQAYAEAGADLIFVEAPQTVDEVRAIPGEVEVPTVFNLVPRGKTPSVPLADLQDYGYRVVIAPGACIGSAATAMRAALLELRAGVAGVNGQDSPRELFDSLGLPFWESIRAEFTESRNHV